MNDQEKEGKFRKKHIRLKAMVHGNPPSAVRHPVLFRLLGVDVLPSVIDWLLLSQNQTGQTLSRAQIRGIWGSSRAANRD